MGLIAFTIVCAGWMISATLVGCTLVLAHRADRRMEEFSRSQSKPKQKSNE